MNNGKMRGIIEYGWMNWNLLESRVSYLSADCYRNQARQLNN